MKTRICETFAFVFAEESTVAQKYVVNFVPRASTIQPVPFFGRSLTFPVHKSLHYKHVTIFLIHYCCTHHYHL